MSKVVKIKENIKRGLKERSKEFENEVVMLRLVLAELENKKVELKLKDVESLTEDTVNEVLMGQLKKLDQELESLEKAKRDTSLVLQQKGILYEYLPKQLTNLEIVKIVTNKVAELKITSIKEQGKLMGVLSKELKGKADLGQVSKIIREVLT